MVELEFQQKTKTLIDSLKSICANYGLGNDGNEFKIITQTFLYKFLNDKFAFEAKKLDGTVELGDLTVICGPNNMGKTLRDPLEYLFM